MYDKIINHQLLNYDCPLNKNSYVIIKFNKYMSSI